MAATYGSIEVAKVDEVDAYQIFHYRSCKQILLHHGADVNAFSGQGGYTPLHKAVQFGRVQAVKVEISLFIECHFKDDVRQTLVDAGANVDVFDNWSWTPLHKATADGYIQIAKVRIAFAFPIKGRRDADPH